MDRQYLDMGKYGTFQAPIMKHGVDVFFHPNRQDREPTFTVPQTVCRRADLDPARTPMHRMIVANDTCRQGIVWYGFEPSDSGGAR